VPAAAARNLAIAARKHASPPRTDGGGGVLYQRRDALALAVGVRVRVLVVAPVALRLVSSGASAKASANAKVSDRLPKLGQELGRGLVLPWVRFFPLTASP
jgi:hypothetical protein